MSNSKSENFRSKTPEQVVIDTEFSVDSLMARTKRSYLIDVGFKGVVKSRLATLDDDTDLPFMSGNERPGDFEVACLESFLDSILLVVDITDRFVTDPDTIDNSDIEKLGGALAFLAQRARRDMEMAEEGLVLSEYLRKRFVGEGDKEDEKESVSIEEYYKEIISDFVLSRLRKENKERGINSSIKEQILSKYRRVVAYFIDPYSAYEEGKKIYMELYDGSDTELDGGDS